MGYAEETFDACAVDPDMGSRMRIKQAALAVHNFKHLTLVSTLAEALQKLEEQGSMDVFFISERLPEVDVTDFIKKTKAGRSGRDAAFVLLIGSTEEGGSKTAKAILTGFDGCLMEPYSVDALVDITKLTATVKHERRESREKAAVDFLVKNIMRQVDRIAFIQQAQMETGTSLKALKDSCDVLKNFEEGTMEYYFEEAVKLFEQADPNTALGVRKNYKGVSKRVKKKIVKQIMTETEIDAAESKKKLG